MSDIPSREELILKLIMILFESEGFEPRGNVDEQWQVAGRIADEVLDAILPLVLAGAGEALQPMAWIAEHDIGETEADKDRFKPMFNHNRAPWLIVGDFRRARAVHAQINTLIGESKGTDTGSKGER